MSNKLTVKQRNALQRVKNEPALEPWLFKKVNDLNWFDAFLDSGYLTPELNPAPEQKSDGTIHIPSWPITEYLVASSLKLKEENDVDTFFFVNHLPQRDQHTKPFGASFGDK